MTCGIVPVLFGVFIGVNFGIVIASLLVAARDGDGR